ncbi:hypothetical protein, partial [Anaerobutyricum hallii]|uniref:hypothetical protein n=1 Tax=Anaerobutyricum hallii TaxID=39488 RepID=UPI003992308E
CVRGLKSIDYWTDEYGFRIVPFTGTGIKVADEIALCCNIISYLSWVRGLKLRYNPYHFRLFHRTLHRYGD